MGRRAQLQDETERKDAYMAKEGKNYACAWSLVF
jgi:hypothetical protein